MSFNNFTNFTNPSHYTVGKINSRQNNSNFSDAYNPAQTLIPQRDGKNYGYALHNNLNDNIVSEAITEYTLYVDAADRDIETYKNPFVFAVSLGGAGNNTINRYKYPSNNGCELSTNNSKRENLSKINFIGSSFKSNQCQTVCPTLCSTPCTVPTTHVCASQCDSKCIGVSSYKTQCTGVPPPRIDSDFKNVKYAKIKYLTLPRTIVYQYTEDASGNLIYSPVILGGTILGNYRYLIMRIKEIANNNMYATNDNIKNDCFILYRDSNYIDAINDIWIATQPIKIFYDDDLRNLNKLTIEIFIPPTPQTIQCALQPLRIMQVDNSSGTPKNVPMPFEILNGLDPKSDFFSKYGLNVLPTMEFELGIYENQMNTSKTYH